jgi:leader peptidase (prepilin peptidase)/N-methyltransferase
MTVETLELLVTIVAGLLVGSFLNVCIARLPSDQSVVRPRSRCPRCKKPIAGYDNIPVLSYLLLGGRCRRCKNKISMRYPAVEVLTAVVSALIFLKFGLGLAWFIYFCFSCALIVLAFIDADHRILPDEITLNGIWIGVLLSLLVIIPSPVMNMLVRYAGFDGAHPRLVSLGASLLGVLVGGGLLWAVGEAYFRVRGFEGMGFGDVKMMAMVGAFLGAPLALLTIMLGSLLGSVVGIAFMRVAGKSRDYELPFGTFLSFAGVLALLYGNDLIQLYVDHLIRPSL